MNSTKCNCSRKGFTLATLLVISLVLFSLLSLAATTSFQLHSINRRAKADLQEKANTVHTDISPRQ